MAHIRISDAARYLRVSDDTVRRLVSSGELKASDSPRGPATVDGAELARYLQRRSATSPSVDRRTSARNRLDGLVTAVKADGVMAQVELQCGPFRVVSLMSSEAVDELRLQPGSVATAVVKSTNVVVETGPE